MKQIHPNISEEDARAQSELIAVLTEGTAYRRNFGGTTLNTAQMQSL